MMFGQPPQGPSLFIIAHGASDLKDVEMLGKQDPYLQFGLDLSNPKSFQKTYTHKNAGKTPSWNQSFEIPLNGEPDLYVEIMDQEATVDGAIGFLAIPINQVVYAPAGTLCGVFDVFLPNGQPQGEVHLTLTAKNIPGMMNTFGGAQPGYAQQQQQPVKGQSYVLEAHQKRVKSLANKEKAGDIGMAVGAGLLAVGAGFLANKVINDMEEEEEEQKRAEEEAEREREQFEEEKRRLEEEQKRLDEEQEAFRLQQELEQREQELREREQELRERELEQREREEEERREREEEERREREEEERREREEEEEEREAEEEEEEHVHHHHHHHHHYDGEEVNEWDPVGCYSAGDKVIYQGTLFMCLQEHESNPTWEPTEAHSLWHEV
ncbi:hypothetical protein BGZ51_007447 [Haplosporangium sp. Z 767]|nr:hypothetical protein BGZ50_007524 [Haplosporangium sp. Z 11]KAF9178821.1 hypothetical protein BGZ51_007447 [Haplosporangium sp. Z 767]